MKPPPAFHPNAPKKLVKLWKKHPAYYRIAKHLQVNPATVWKAMRNGEEPKGEAIRVKFGLPRKPRKPKAEPKEIKTIPQYRKWWNSLDPEIREMYIRETYEEWIQRL
jgi:hypothetical protein